MIFLFVSLIISVVRLFSWIPGVDTMNFVVGLHFIVGMLFIFLLDEYTRVWQNLINRAKLSRILALLVAMILLDTTSIWLNLIGITIITFLIWRYGRDKSGRSFKKALRDWLDQE